MLTTFGVNRPASCWLAVLLLFTFIVQADDLYYDPNGVDSQSCCLSSSGDARTGKKMAVNTVHDYATEVAKKLFKNVDAGVKQRPIMVSSFVDVVSLRTEPTSRDPMALLGLQLEESFITLAADNGFHVKENRTRTSIAMLETQTQVLSRNQAFLEREMELGYFLTGTLTRQESGAIVNARLVDLSNNQVVSAAVRFIPESVFQETQRSSWFNGRLYRNEYQYPVEESQ